MEEVKALPYGAAGVLLLALGLLAAHAPRQRLQEMDIVTLNDQVGYITTARWLAETGELRGHLVCPAFIRSEDWRLYMPGNYTVLAASFWLFGYGPFQARLPNLLAYVVGALLVYGLGRRLYGRASGLVAASLVLLFPPHLGFTFTAMAETVFATACLAALYLFLRWPAGSRAWAMPFLLALPFLFRETGALLILPMLALAWGAATRPRPVALAAGVVGSILCLGAIYSWQTSTGKQSPPLSWIVEGKPNYGDATLEGSNLELSVGEWIQAFWGNFSENVDTLAERMTTDFFVHGEPAFTSTLLLTALVCLVGGLLRFRKDLYPLSVGLVGLATWLLLLFFHKAYEHVAIRHILFVLPLSAIYVAHLLVQLHRRLHARWGASIGRAAAILFAVVALGLHTWGMQDIVRRFVVESPPELTRYMEALEHDDSKLLVSSPRIGLDYTLKHYPVRWSFVPDNEETLRLLAERHEIGTLIVRTTFTDPEAEKLTVEALERNGLHFQGYIRLESQNKKPPYKMRSIPYSVFQPR